MSLPINDQLRALLADSVKKPQLIIEIDGLPAFGSVETQKYAAYGDEGLYYGMPGLVYGGLVDDKKSYPYINLDRSTNNITQQMLVDKGGFSSITSFDLSLIDKDQMITQLITPGNTVEDIISRKVKCYLSFEGAGHPKDSIEFFNGIVGGVSSGAGFVNINLASPEKLKNLEIFPIVSATLTANISAVATTITVDSTSDFTIPADNGTLRAYLKLNDEIIEYTSKSSTQFLGCVRGQLGTLAADHQSGDNIESRYRLIGNLRDLCLKLMLSGLNEPYLSDEQILSINTYGPNTVSNSVFVARYNFDQYYGTVPGDTITISGDDNPSNNISAVITSIVTNDLGSYLTVDEPLTTSGAGGVFSVTSKYAVLPKFTGLEMTPDQVDVLEFERKYTQFSASFFEYDFFIEESVNGNEFINTQILYPSGAYALPRKAKTSMGLTIPPLAEYEIKTINATNVTNASGLKITRNISSNFYNAIIIKYDKSTQEDKFLRGKIRQSADSTNRIKIANKPLQIEAEGVRAEENFSSKFQTIGRRFLERYQYGAESIEVDVDYGTGFTIELGDTVILAAEALQVSDIKDGNASRSFKPRLFEVQNKSLNLKGTPIRLSLVDTAFNLNRRYGVISPSSIVSTGSTRTNLNLQKSYGTNLRTTGENFKWVPIVGYRLKVFNTDYSYNHETVITAIDPGNDNGIIVDPPLPSAPLEGYKVSVANYSTSIDPADQVLPKALYVYFNNQIQVVSGLSDTSFTVSGPALADIKVNYLVSIHNDDYSRLSVEAVVTDITGNTVTVDKPLGFTPQLDDRIDLLGFVDGGRPYAWL